MSKSGPQVVILFGRSGCGKGTQTKLITKEFGFDHIATGDLIRARIKGKDQTAQTLKDFSEKGKLVPTELVFKIWGEKIEEMSQKTDLKGLVIDGSPRSLEEAKLMDNLFSRLNWQNIKVILVDISEEEAYDRLTKRRICQDCGQLIPWVGHYKDIEKCDKCQGELVTRPDDKPGAIKSRLEYYLKDVQPAIDYYQDQGRLTKVNGQQTIEAVYQEIKQFLKNDSN